MEKKKKGSCLGSILKFLLVIIILVVVVVAIGYFAIKQPSGSAGKIAETVMSPFVSKEIKTSMDSTEELLDKYIELTKTIGNGDNAEIITEMNDYMEKYQKAMNDLNAIDKDSLGILSRLYVSLRYFRLSDKAMKVQREMVNQ